MEMTIDLSHLLNENLREDDYEITTIGGGDSASLNIWELPDYVDYAFNLHDSGLSLTLSK